MSNFTGMWEFVAGVGLTASIIMLLMAWLRRSSDGSRGVSPEIYWATFGLVVGMSTGYWMPGMIAAVSGGLAAAFIVGAMMRDTAKASALRASILGIGAAGGFIVGYFVAMATSPLLVAVIIIAVFVVVVSYRRKVPSSSSSE